MKVYYQTLRAYQTETLPAAVAAVEGIATLCSLH
jgi:hypothetical protein